MTKSYYDLLDLPRTASADEIKHAFRREIARYHPDKVLHLGLEFQEIARARAAELTQAYQMLSDASTRAAYDALVETPGPTAADVRAPVEPAPERPCAAPLAEERAEVGALVRRAMLARFHQALAGEFGRYERPPVSGFEITCVPVVPFWRLRPSPGVLGRIVARVDRPAIAEAWSMAARATPDGRRSLCVFVLGPELTDGGTLASAVAEQRRRRPAQDGGALVIVPASTRNWSAHVPADAPPFVTSLLARLRSG